MKFLRLPIFLLVFVLSLGLVIAQTTQFALTSIGSVSTVGQTFTYFTVSEVNPSLQGTASPSASVSVTIDTVSESVVTASDGEWRYDPTTLVAGNHDVIISSSGEDIAFTLHIASSSSQAESKGGLTSTTSADLPEELPQTGVFETTLLYIAMGFLLIGGGFLIRDKIAPDFQ